MPCYPLLTSDGSGDRRPADLTFSDIEEENTMFDEKKLYTFAEARELLRVGKTHLYELLRSGRIDHYKLAGKYFISGAELEKFLKERED